MSLFWHADDIGRGLRASKTESNRAFGARTSFLCETISSHGIHLYARIVMVFHNLITLLLFNVYAGYFSPTV